VACKRLKPETYWPSYQLERNCQHKSISAEEHDVNDFQSSLTTQCSFLHRSCLGTPFSILSFQLRVKWMHPLPVNRLNTLPSFLQRRICLMARTRMFLWSSLITYGIRFVQSFRFPPVVGEDTISTCWRDSHCRRNCRAWHTALMFKDRFYFFHVALIRRRCWASTLRGIVCMSRPFLMTYTHRRTVSYEEASVRKLSFKDL
jgi:hypothetical protein